MKKQNIVILCAHSDDQIFGPGGSLIKYAKQGHRIYTYIFSYGEMGLAWLQEKEAIKIRVKESEKVDKFIGGKGVWFFGLKEGKFDKEAKEKKIQEKIISIIKKRKPSKIFTHSPNDPLPDHRANYKIVIDALDKMRYKGDVYVFDVWNPITLKRRHLPRLYEDISGTFHKKIKALNMFSSQKMALWSLLWSVYVRAILHGIKIKKRYAERFFKVR